MKKCPECNNLVEDNLKECSKCGFPLEDMRVEKEEVAEEISVEAVDNDISKEVVEEKNVKEKKSIPKKLIIGIIGSVTAIVLIIFFATSNVRTYNKGKELYSQKNIKKLLKNFRI